jgi:hypothetical protein
VTAYVLSVLGLVVLFLLLRVIVLEGRVSRMEGQR